MSDRFGITRSCGTSTGCPDEDHYRLHPVPHLGRRRTPRGGVPVNREQMIEKARLAILNRRGPGKHPGATKDAAAVVDALLPQVTTVEELEALPNGTSLLRTDETGAGLYDWCTGGRGGLPKLWMDQYSIPASSLAEYLPLTVVWQP